MNLWTVLVILANRTSFVVIQEDVYPRLGNVMVILIVPTERMSPSLALILKYTRVSLHISSVIIANVSQVVGVVTMIVTVVMVRMRSTVHHAIVLSQSFNVIMGDVSALTLCVMERTTVLIIVTRLIVQCLVLILSSNVQTLVIVLMLCLCVMVMLTVLMDQMRLTVPARVKPMSSLVLIINVFLSTGVVMGNQTVMITLMK
uniref:NADH dehydrogenase subunit 6 n=1 Tax=Cacopsylla melanoneura TaxID=428564 RepID=A0A8D8VT33_9HEMI